MLTLRNEGERNDKGVRSFDKFTKPGMNSQPHSTPASCNDLCPSLENSKLDNPDVINNVMVGIMVV